MDFKIVTVMGQDVVIVNEQVSNFIKGVMGEDTYDSMMSCAIGEFTKNAEYGELSGLYYVTQEFVDFIGEDLERALAFAIESQLPVGELDINRILEYGTAEQCAAASRKSLYYVIKNTTDPVIKTVITVTDDDVEAAVESTLEFVIRNRETSAHGQLMYLLGGGV